MALVKHAEMQASLQQVATHNPQQLESKKKKRKKFKPAILFVDVLLKSLVPLMDAVEIFSIIWALVNTIFPT